LDPATISLIIFAEQMAALAAKTILQIRDLVSGNSGLSVDQILADADSNYQTVISGAKLTANGPRQAYTNTASGWVPRG
jgi:hypothetical protein